MGELLKEMGQRMLARRKQLRLTQETLAKMAHVTPQTISTAELGTKAMRPETILNVCEALDISTDYLLRGQVIDNDTRLLHHKISSLTPSQYRHLENIIDSYIAALQEKKRYRSRLYLPHPIPLFYRLRKAAIVLDMMSRVTLSISSASPISAIYSGSCDCILDAGAIFSSSSRQAPKTGVGFLFPPVSSCMISRTMASMVALSMTGATTFKGCGSSGKFAL